MTPARPVSRWLAVAAGVAAVSLPAAARASTQLYKCVEGGRTVYQQQACPITAQAESMASGPRTVSAAPASAPAGTSPKLKPASPPASAAPATPR
jgi:hypothetical protein